MGSSQRGDYYSIRGRRWYLTNVPDKIVIENIRALMLEVGWRDGLEGWMDGGGLAGVEGWMDGGMKSMRRRRPEEGVEGWAGVASHRMLPFAVMGGSEGLSRLPAYLAAAPGLCVMGVVGGTLARVTRSHPQSNRCNGPPTPPCRPPASQPEPPREKVVSGLWPVAWIEWVK
jgi:hypothetical protein